MNNSNYKTVEEYISSFPLEVQNILQKIRHTIQNASPGSVETISYAIPTFKLNGKSIVHFAAYLKHIGFYATPSGQTEFTKKLSIYKQGKGSVQFPLDQKIPYKLIAEITKFRTKEILNSNNKK